MTISIVDDFSSLLTISSLERGHAGNYTCLASNEAGSDLYTAILDVQGDFRKQYNLFLFVCLNKQTNKTNLSKWIKNITKGLKILWDGTL